MTEGKASLIGTMYLIAGSVVLFGLHAIMLGV